MFSTKRFSDVAGLIDCTKDDFDGYYELLENKWENHSGEVKQFADYFRKNKLEDIRRTMLLEQRVSSGMGLSVYTQNASECMNRVVKGGMDVKKMELDQFVEYMRDISRKQKSETEAACLEEINGVSLHADYMHLRIREEDFYGSTSVVTSSMRTAQKEKIHKAKLIIPDVIQVVKEKALPDR